MKKILIILLTLIMLTGCGQLDNTSDDSVNMPDIVFLERVYNDNDGFLGISFTDSNGDCYTSADKEICGLVFEELIEKYKSGGLDGKIIKSGSRNPEELQSNYKKLCETVSQNECNIVYPKVLPSVETESYSWYGLYYDENDSLKSQIIHANKCMTSLRSDNDIINEIYKWYNDSYTADSDESGKMPDIVFLERVYNNSDGFIKIGFTDSNGDCYTSADKEVCNLSVAELIDKYKSGGLNGKIIKNGSRNPEELRSNYKKLCETVSQNECNIIYPDSLPDVVADSYSWYGLYYNKNGEFKTQVIHEDECETGLNSDCDAINEIYKWYNDSYTADSDVSVEIPDIVFLERVYRNADGFIKIGFTDSNGDCYTSADKEVCNLSVAELIDKYKSGGLNGKFIKNGSRNPEELRSNYKKLCETVSQNECNIVYPDSLPDVVADFYSWYGLYYNKNGEFKTQVIHENECETGLNSDCDAINEIYKWYNDSYTADSDVSAEMPDIVFLERVYSNTDGFIKIWFTVSSGDCYGSDDKEVCSLSFEELIGKYKSGSLDGKIKKFDSSTAFFQQEEIWSNYKKLCEAVSQNDCNIVYPDSFNDVESVLFPDTDTYSWYGLYYDENEELKAQVIHQNECNTRLDSDCDDINEIYKWYTGNYISFDD